MYDTTKKGRKMRRISRIGLLAGAALGVMAAGCGDLAQAQAAPPAGQGAQPAGALEEIVVTARRRNESLLDVPVAVTAITPAAIRNHNVTDLAKLGELAPQVLIGTASTGTGALLTIRGISSSPLDPGLDQSVSVEIDGVQLSRGRIITQTLYDIQQVQVLQGPQALFFGKNSPAGVISIKSSDPTSGFEGYARGGYEFHAHEKFGEGAVSGPITDTLRGRIAMRVSAMDGWIRNNATPTPDPLFPGVTMPGANDSTSPKGHDVAVRVALQWLPTSDFDALLKVSFDEQKLNGGGAFGQSWCANGKTVPVELGIPDTQGTCALNMSKAVSALPPFFAVNYPYGNNGVPYQDSKNVLTSLVLTKRFENVTVTSTTGYYWQDVADSDGYDWSSFTQVYDAEHERYNLVTQEVRANTSFSIPVNFTGGIYFEHFTRPHFNAPFLLPLGINPATGNWLNNEQTADNSGQTISLFGEARWNILPTLELAAGARWTHETKDMKLGNIAVNPVSAVPGLMPAGEFISGHYSDHNISPEATLTWHPAPNQTLYAAYKTGFKSGGFSDPATLLDFYTADTLRFGHETSKGEEIGYKAELLDRQLRLDLTAYRYKYDGLQVSAFNATTITYTIRNAASARTEGVQASATWAAARGLTFNGSLGYNKARFLSFPTAQCYSYQTEAAGCVDGVQDLTGHPLVRAPKVTFDLGGEYVRDVGADWTVDMAMDGAYTTSYVTEENEDPLSLQPAFWRLNASVKLAPANGRYALSLIGRNLTNAYYIVSANDRPLGGLYEYAGWFGRPREVVLQAEYHF
jgi:outer membrane receptor protein involved in Fe transport